MSNLYERPDRDSNLAKRIAALERDVCEIKAALEKKRAEQVKNAPWNKPRKAGLDAARAMELSRKEGLI